MFRCLFFLWKVVKNVSFIFSNNLGWVASMAVVDKSWVQQISNTVTRFNRYLNISRCAHVSLPIFTPESRLKHVFYFFEQLAMGGIGGGR